MKKNGGTVFPMYGDGEKLTFYDPGMTLLDYIAMKAMQAIIKSGREYSMIEQGNIAIWSYNLAEIMLREKEKRDAE